MLFQKMVGRLCNSMQIVYGLSEGPSRNRLPLLLLAEQVAQLLGLTYYFCEHERQVEDFQLMHHVEELFTCHYLRFEYLQAPTFYVFAIVYDCPFQVS